jgi:hypothetical protein
VCIDGRVPKSSAKTEQTTVEHFRTIKKLSPVESLAAKKIVVRSALQIVPVAGLPQLRRSLHRWKCVNVVTVNRGLRGML